MPDPNREHAQIMRDLSMQMLTTFPTASVFHWQVVEDPKTDEPHAYITMLLDHEGGRLDELFPPGNVDWTGYAEQQIVRRYERQLGWASNERDASYVFSVKDAREITDTEGTCTMDPGYENHPGLEWLR
ncbi:hypothetical protein [Arthrobacter sp. USHLN218]|uniref:hypothetical protein n=1 Tax=Arthrobacter sp. USHLN218 TaxID=3081232 RepID=UPI00301718B2